MLTKIESAQAATASTKTQITLRFDAATNTIVYAVPPGKTCTGQFFGDPNNNGSVNMNNANVWFSRAGSPGVISVPVVLLAGTVLRARSSEGNCSFIGVEE